MTIGRVGGIRGSIEDSSSSALYLLAGFIKAMHWPSKPLRWVQFPQSAPNTRPVLTDRAGYSFARQDRPISNDVPMFRRKQFPKVGGNKPVQGLEKGLGRGSYDAKWDRLSVKFRKANPFCRFCEQEGHETSPAEDVDHINPLRPPFNGAKYDWKNLQPLCRFHHYGIKAKLEHYAERTGQIDQIGFWCESIDNRPDMTQRTGHGNVR